MGEILCFLLNFPAKTLYHMGLQFSSGGCRSISFLLKICNIYFLFCLKETCCVSWFLIKKITLVFIIMWFWKTLSAWQLIFFIFFTKHKNFTHTLHSNKIIITATALYWQKELHYLFLSLVIGGHGQLINEFIHYLMGGGVIRGSWRPGSGAETLVVKKGIFLPDLHMTRSNRKIYV